MIPEDLGLDNPPEDRLARLRKIANNKSLHTDEEQKIEIKSADGDGVAFIEKTVSSAKTLRCFFGTSTSGYLYDINNPRLLHDYPFTENCFVARATTSLLYTLTSSGLVMWSLRSCSSAGESFPPPCILGLNLFYFSIINISNYLYIILGEERSTYSQSPTTFFYQF